MFEVEPFTRLSTSPLRVWTALSDLAGFVHWHPFIRLSAPAQGLRYVGDKITADATGGEMTINRAGHAAHVCRRT